MDEFVGLNRGSSISISKNIQYRKGYPYYIPNIQYPGPVILTQPPDYTELKGFLTVDYIPDGPNTRLRDYFRIDLNYTFEKKLKRGDLQWQISLLNATNRNNPYAVYRQGDTYKAFVLLPFFPSIAVKRSF